MLWAGFILGLLGSLHCIGMCGPIAFMLPVDRNNSGKRASQISTYHLGRLLAYSSIGILFGLIGRSLKLFGFQQQLSIVIGALMIVIVILPYGRFRNNTLSKPLFLFVSRLKSGIR